MYLNSFAKQTKHLTQMKYYISESNWSTILTFLKSQKGLHTKDTKKLRVFIEAVFYILKTGAQWGYLHEDYGNSRTIHKRYKYWADKGIWSNLMSYISVNSSWLIYYL
ncbi:hypothetical protein FSC454_03645 [Francisella hispaniensis FSC454]|uniref:Insertion element IS402-like domain-containing protein n=2 Tax=Francisella hispaniensis TaxID=622488 RepID=A0AAC9J6Q3_9GAMM|nr:hypothetical protein FSC454_03645 [Francisella hispaniensis FSC454]